MALTKLTTELNKISTLATIITGQATTTKAAFDHDVNVVKDYINDTLIPEVEGLDVNQAGLLNTHRTSSDHDGRYYTETEIDSLLASKTSLTGNHQGTWQGYSPTQTDPGIQAVVDEHTAQLADVANKISDITKQYNIATYMRGGKTAIEAMNDIVAAINDGTASTNAIYFPAGIYDFTNIAAPFTILKSDVQIHGDGRTATTLQVQKNTFIEYGSATFLCERVAIKDLRFECPTIPDITQCCVSLFWCAGAILDFEIRKVACAIKMTPVVVDTHYSTGCVARIDGGKYNIGVPLIILNRGAGFWFYGNTYNMGVVTVPHGSTLDSVLNSDFIRISSFDTIVINGLQERYCRGIYIDVPTGNVVMNTLINSWFDYCKLSCVYGVTTGGVISNLTISPGVELSCWESAAVLFDNQGGFILDTMINGTRIPIAGDVGISVKGVTRSTIRDNMISGIGQLSAGNNGIYVHGTSEYINVKDNNLVDGTNLGTPWGTQPYIFIEATPENFEVSGNNAYGIIVQDSVTAKKNRKCINNSMSALTSDWNYGLNKGAWTVPASNVEYAHLSAKEIMLTIYGGTATAIVYNGVSLWIGTGVLPFIELHVKSGDTLKITYTAVPTANYVTLP